MKLLAWLKTLQRIVPSYDDDLAVLYRRINGLEQLLRERTDIGVDVAYTGRDRSHVIVVGRYRNTDFVQTYSLHPADFTGLVEHLKQMERHGVVRHMDAPPTMKTAFQRLRGGGFI